MSYRGVVDELQGASQSWRVSQQIVYEPVTVMHTTRVVIGDSVDRRAYKHVGTSAVCSCSRCLLVHPPCEVMRLCHAAAAAAAVETNMAQQYNSV